MYFLCVKKVTIPIRFSFRLSRSLPVPLYLTLLQNLHELRTQNFDKLLSRLPVQVPDGYQFLSTVRLLLNEPEPDIQLPPFPSVSSENVWHNALSFPVLPVKFYLSYLPPAEILCIRSFYFFSHSLCTFRVVIQYTIRVLLSSTFCGFFIYFFPRFVYNHIVFIKSFDFYKNFPVQQKAA